MTANGRKRTFGLSPNHSFLMFALEKKADVRATSSVLYKTRYSGFYNTELEAVLNRKGIEYLVVTGCTTSVCVESTIRDAMFRDFSCLLLEDCTGEPIGFEFSRSNHDASLLLIQALFGWVSDSQCLLTALEGAEALAAPAN